MRRSTSGFTVIELLVIIIVLGIIAAIVIVAYTGIQKAALNSQRGTELLGWRTSFEKYKAANGQYPVMATGGYCLGTGFPNGKCRNYNSATNVYTEADSVALMTALNPYDPPTAGTRVPVENVTVGPYADYTTTNINLSAPMTGIDESDCPEGSYKSWDDGATRMICRIQLVR